MVVQECARVNWFLISKEVSSCKALVCFGYGFEFSLRCVLFSQTFPLSHYDLLEQSLPLYNILRSHVNHKSSLLSSPLPPPSLPVPENAKLLAWVGDELLPREMAKV